MLALVMLSSSGFTLPSVGIAQPTVGARDVAHRAVTMSEDVRGKQRKSSENFDTEGAWSSLDKFNGEPETLYGKVMWKGAGLGLMFYMPDLKKAWSEVAGDERGYISVEDMAVLAANVGGPDSEEGVAKMCATIEKEQGIADNGFFFQQWTKYMNDFARANPELKGKV